MNESLTEIRARLDKAMCPCCEDETEVVFGIKHDQGKPMMGLIPPKAELLIAEVLTFGANKYAPENWRKIESADQRYMDAAMRHINAYRQGEVFDPQSNLPHLACAATSLMFVLELQHGKIK